MFFAAGCGQPKVTGTVSYSDGTPLERGTVNFQTETHAAMGAISKEGHYIIGGEKAGDGVPPGTYKVFITGAMALDTSGVKPLEFGQGPGTIAPVIQLIDKKYERPETSDLTCEVKGSTVFNIEVKRPGEQ
jgi:hypothetical protein